MRAALLPSPAPMEVGTAEAVALEINRRPDTSTPTDRTERFAALLTAHWERAYRLAYHLAGNTADADDLVQEAAEEAFRAFDRFQEGTRFDRWFLRILHNSFIDRVRRARRRRLFSLETLAIPPHADHAADPEEALAGALDGPVRRALLALPPDFRAAVVLVDLEGLPYEDAAHVLRLPIGTVRSRLHRGRLALREWLRPYVDAAKRGEV